MREGDLASPLPYHILELQIYLLQVWILHLVIPGELLDDELAICPEFDACGTKCYCLLDPEKRCRVFCDIVGCDSDIFETLFN